MLNQANNQNSFAWPSETINWETGVRSMQRITSHATHHRIYSFNNWRANYAAYTDWGDSQFSSIWVSVVGYTYSGSIFWLESVKRNFLNQVCWMFNWIVGTMKPITSHGPYAICFGKGGSGVPNITAGTHNMDEGDGEPEGGYFGRTQRAESTPIKMDSWTSGEVTPP